MKVTYQLLAVQRGLGLGAQVLCGLLFPLYLLRISLFWDLRKILCSCLSFSEARKPRPNLSMVPELIDLYLLWISRS